MAIHGFSKIIRRKKENKDGSYSLAIQIIKDRRKSISHLGVHVRGEDWDDLKQRVKKSHPNSARLNNFLVQKLAEANDKVLEVETHKKEASARALKETYCRGPIDSIDSKQKSCPC